jgi:glycosyltransferase involved in cell wall biosynthesis
MNSNNKQPLFSIITTTYNRTRFLEDCLISLYEQDCTDYEHIIVDGNSDDGTFELVKNVTDKYKEKSIRIYQREPKGVYDAFNFAIKKANGKYIHLLNSDDYFANNKVLSNIKQIILENNYPNWIQGVRIMNHHGIKQKSSRLREPFGHQQAFIKKSVHEEIGLYNLDYNYSSDVEFYLRLKSYTKPIWINLETVIQNTHKDSLTMSFKGNTRWIPEVLKIYTKHYTKKLKKNRGAEDRS